MLMALNTENKKKITTLNAETETTTLDAELKQRLWMPKGIWTVALNDKWKASNGSKLQTKESDMITLNVDPKPWLWTPNWNGGSERQMEKERWLWMTNGKWTMALNAKPNWVTMNVKLRKMTLNVVTRKTRRLWMSNCKGMMGEICRSIACRHNSQSIGRVWKRLHKSRKMLCWWVGMIKSNDPLWNLQKSDLTGWPSWTQYNHLLKNHG